jgi:uncharacterized protein YecT (DUF1311 family)
MKRSHCAALAFILATVLAGCDQREPDCTNPKTQDDKQQCAHKESTEGRIKPTEKPKNWLEVKP